MERRLLVLGLLRIQTLYGYHLNEIIEQHMGTSIRIKKPTLYQLLGKMEVEGWISATEEQEGNRPPRRVYAVTPQGEAAFQRLLRENVAGYDPAEFRGDVGLLFLDELPRKEALALLRDRRDRIAQLLETVREYEAHPGSMQLVIEHQLRHLATELEWTDEIIDRMGASDDESN